MRHLRTFRHRFYSLAKPRIHEIRAGFSQTFTPREIAHIFRRLDDALSPLSSGLYPKGKYRSKLRCLGWKLSIIWAADDECTYENERPWKVDAVCAYGRKLIGMTVTYHSELVKNWSYHQYAFRTAIGCVLAHEYAHTNQKVSYVKNCARQTYRMTPTDRKSTRLNSSHLGISYAVFCLK